VTSSLPEELQSGALAGRQAMNDDRLAQLRNAL
jgi:hypothetical protein